jgi:hypothetical protein
MQILTMAVVNMVDDSTVAGLVTDVVAGSTVAGLVADPAVAEFPVDSLVARMIESNLDTDEKSAYMLNLSYGSHRHKPSET